MTHVLYSFAFFRLRRPNIPRRYDLWEARMLSPTRLSPSHDVHRRLFEVAIRNHGGRQQPLDLPHLQRSSHELHAARVVRRGEEEGTELAD